MSEVKRYLIENESIEKTFRLSDCIVYATNRRLLVKRHRSIRDFSYDYISSIGYEYKRYFGYVFVGIVFIVIGWVFYQFSETLSFLTDLSGLFFLLAIIFIVLGIIKKSEWLEIAVLGFSDPIRFEGERKDLDILIKIIREKQVSR